jgi:hypothetical protein
MNPSQAPGTNFNLVSFNLKGCLFLGIIDQNFHVIDLWKSRAQPHNTLVIAELSILFLAYGWR